MVEVRHPHRNQPQRQIQIPLPNLAVSTFLQDARHARRRRVQEPPEGEGQRHGESVTTGSGLNHPYVKSSSC